MGGWVTYSLRIGELEIVDVVLGVLRGLKVHAEVGGLGGGEVEGGEVDGERAALFGQGDGGRRVCGLGGEEGNARSSFVVGLVLGRLII